MFWSKNNKCIPVYTRVYYMNGLFEGVFITRICSLDDSFWSGGFIRSLKVCYFGLLPCHGSKVFM